MANLTSTELVFLYDAATYALYTGNLALGQLASTLINSSMFGVLSLSALAAGALLVPRSRRDVRNISLLLATGAMYAGTTVYFAFRLRNLSHDVAATFTNAVALFSDLQSCYLASIGATVSSSTQCTTSQSLSDLAGPSDLPPQYCAGTAALTINAVLGNAILCWRACALWPRRRMVPLVLGSLLLATCALGIADTRAACRGAAKEDPLTLDGPSVGSFYVGKNFGLAAASLAFVTVLSASALIGFRTWQLRAGIRARLRQGSVRARMGGALALTVELGVVYCVIWGFIVGATATMDQSSGAIEDTDTGFEEIVYTPTPFMQGFWVFDLGALTPLTAIYPLLLVVVVALNKSLLFEHDRDGFERISDDAQRARALGEPRSPTQWRRKFLLASPQPALIDQRASGGAGVEAFALSHKRSSSGWEEVDAVSLGKGEVL